MDGIGLNVRKLVALDMALHGKRFIVAEFAAGVILCGALGFFSVASGLREHHHGPIWQ